MPYEPSSVLTLNNNPNLNVSRYISLSMLLQEILNLTSCHIYCAINNFILKYQILLAHVFIYIIPYVQKEQNEM